MEREGCMLYDAKGIQMERGGQKERREEGRQKGDR